MFPDYFLVTLGGYMEKPAKREQLASRLGFLLISAGCAIGLGNVWRFPFITGEYGGACFLLLFIVCQLMVMPVMICEFAIGRASRLNLGMALGRLEPRGTKWHKFSWLNIVGIYTLLMFYTTICGWIVLYTWYMFTGTFEGLPPDAVGKFFGSFTGSAGQMTLGMSLSVLCGAAVCFLGLQNGVERIVKFMMAGLFIILVILAVHSMTLPGAPEGLSFYLKPDLEKFRSIGFFPIASAALNQAFFTLSVGVGSMCIFGSYISKEHSLPGEVCFITGMDFLVALIAGLIIFPACFTFGVHPSQGPGLVFVALPNIFASMENGRLWGTLFFVFMSFAALTTVIAVFENMVSYFIDRYGMHRRRALDPTLCKGILHALRDSFPGIRQCAVKIKQTILIHLTISFPTASASQTDPRGLFQDSLPSCSASHLYLRSLLPVHFPLPP